MVPSGDVLGLMLLGAQILRDIRQRVQMLPLAAPGRHPDEGLEMVTEPALQERILRVLTHYDTEADRNEALMLVIGGMATEHARVFRPPEREWVRT